MAQSSSQSGNAVEIDSRFSFSFEQITSGNSHADTDEAANRALTSILVPAMQEKVREGFRRLKRSHRQFGTISDQLLLEVNDDIWSSLHPIIKEEMQKEVGRLGTDRNPMQRVATPAPVLKLCFASKFPETIYANIRIADPSNNPIKMKLTDCNTEDIYVNPLPPIEVTFEVISSENFCVADAITWDSDRNNLSKYILKSRKRKGPLLLGKSTSILLNTGIGQIEDLYFTDNTNRTTVRLVALARIKYSNCRRMTIKCAISDEFIVKDRPGKAYEKHSIPALDDEVWRLETIAKRGIYHKKLIENGINNVRDVLIKWMADPKKLKELLGMNDDHWRKFINHANKCDKGNSRFMFNSGNNIVIVFDAIGVIMQVVIEGVIYEYGNLDKQYQIQVSELASQAYESWGELQEATPGELECMPHPLPLHIAVGKSIDINFQRLQAPAAAGNWDPLLIFDGCSNWVCGPDPMSSETNASTSLVQNRANLEEPYQGISSNDASQAIQYGA